MRLERFQDLRLHGDQRHQQQHINMVNYPRADGIPDAPCATFPSSRVVDMDKHAARWDITVSISIRDMRLVANAVPKGPRLLRTIPRNKVTDGIQM
jgi:hypothetical protein